MVKNREEEEKSLLDLRAETSDFKVYILSYNHNNIVNK